MCIALGCVDLNKGSKSTFDRTDKALLIFNIADLVWIYLDVKLIFLGYFIMRGNSK